MVSVSLVSTSRLIRETSTEGLEIGIDTGEKDSKSKHKT